MDQKEVEESLEPALNALGYPEAAQHVYGMTYGDWKDRYQKKATPEQLKAFQENTEIQAKHDKELLKPRTTDRPPLLSNVCCQDEEVVAQEPDKNSLTSVSFQPPALPETLPSPLTIAVLTVSDRASKNEYSSGDLSGPAVVTAVQKILPLAAFTTAIVPDESTAIQSQLQGWCDDDKIHVILSTGGTGFSLRNVTREATRAVLEQECPGLLAVCTTECSRLQPMASLSRVANLPGNPKAVSSHIAKTIEKRLYGCNVRHECGSLVWIFGFRMWLLQRVESRNREQG